MPSHPDRVRKMNEIPQPTEGTLGEPPMNQELEELIRDINKPLQQLLKWPEGSAVNRLAKEIYDRLPKGV